MGAHGSDLIVEDPNDIPSNILAVIFCGGSGEDLTIKELDETIKTVVGFEGDIVFDPSKPDGNLRKLMDSQRQNSLGWAPTIGLEDGLALAYADFVKCQ